jgi:lipopolysaccharide/colanic/teichoic acid biosynthesis glycosyltransferase
MKKNRSLYFLDLLILLIAFTIPALIKRLPLFTYYQNYFTSVLPLLISWFPVSFYFKKYRPIKSHRTIRRFLLPILQANLVILGISALVMITLHQKQYSIIVIFGTIFGATVGEILAYNTLHYVGRLHDTIDENMLVKTMRSKTEVTETGLKRLLNDIPADEILLKSIREDVVNEVGEEVYATLDHWVNLCSPECQIVSTTSRFNVQKLPGLNRCIVNLHRINDMRYLNKFFETVNQKLGPDGIFIGFAETKDLRKQRILRKFPPVLNYLVYFLDYLVKRVFPKFKLTKKIYFLLTRGENRVLSKAEVFGRLYSCGFEVLDEVFVNRHLYFLARKTGSPHYPADPTYGPLIKLRRVGKNGKIINVYKLRTMHPYAEYLQAYIYKKYNLQAGGKFKDDFRVSTLGRFLRKFWIDELPMLYNLLKGDLKMVGVRPLSQHYLSLYTSELQEKRKLKKPGLIPPFYADMPKTLEEIMASEMRYLDAHEKHPVSTDLKYFFKALYNIIFRRARSN